MAIPPRREVLVDVEQDLQKSKRQVQYRFVAVQVYQECGGEGLVRQPEFTLRDKPGVQLLLRDRIELFARRPQPGKLALDLFGGQRGVPGDRSGVVVKHLVDGV